MLKFYIFMIGFFALYAAKAQFNDNFSDGNYTHAPVWSASPGDFIINENFQLQSDNQIPNATFSIYTENELAISASWEFWIKLDFNTSSLNYTDVWLISADNDFVSTQNEGYFVRIGGKDDNISLYKKKTESIEQPAITGTNGILNAPSSALKVKIIRTVNNKWILLRDMTGTGDSYKSEGEITDEEIQSSSFFGILVKQSTASFFQKHYFDDFIVKEFADQPESLNIISVKVVSSNSVQIIFDNYLNKTSVEDITHYHANGIGSPVSALIDDINGKIINLQFENDFIPNEQISLLIDNVADVFGNVIREVFTDFIFFRAAPYDVVIAEVFADPSPQVGLPDKKFIELKNVSDFPINLTGWELRDDSHNAILPAIELQPDSLLIITTGSGIIDYSSYGKTVSVTNFPSLKVAGDYVSLHDNSGNTIHAVQYTTDTYQNEVKKEGGFSLEMIDTKAGCIIERNWIASNDPSGGTPGRKNSVDGQQIEKSRINITKAFPEQPDVLVIYLSKTADSTSSVIREKYSISGEMEILEIEAIPPFFNAIRITLATPIEDQKIYTITVTGLSDCVGNTIGEKNTVSFGLPEHPDKREIIINEVLSNPKTRGAEYIELYNNSHKITDVGHMFIANKNSTGDLSSITQISNEPHLLLPGEFLLLTKDPASTARDYFKTDQSAILKMSSLPSFPNDNGFVLILDRQGNILDEINYDKSWHFPLIKDQTGISLERIDYNGPSDGSNFYSAAKDAGYGTPGVKNSQHKEEGDTNGGFSLSTEIFSPDNDGIDDFLTINYSFSSTGYITNIKIFDAAGRVVRHLQKNAVASLKGFYRWDGLDEQQQRLPQGIYIIYFESYSESGQKVIHKKSVVLARKK